MGSGPFEWVAGAERRATNRLRAEIAGTEWFESVAEAERRAKRRLPKSVYWAVYAGSEKGETLAGNVEAFGELGFAPHVAGLPAKRDLSTTVMGQSVSLPVLLSPTGVQAVHPDGEVAVARAAANRGTAVGLSSFGSKPVEEVAAANPKTLFQMYWIGGREEMAARVDRARAAGAVGLIVTLDWTFANGRDWGSPKIPERMNVSTIVRYLPQAIVRPRWLARYARTLRPPDLTVPNMVPPGWPAPTFFSAYRQWMATPLPSWDDVAWLRRLWGGPFMVKGITRVDDARRAVDMGATAISVSNHGGNDLDGTPATIRVLPAVAAAVGGQVEVLLDGGIRRGGDVVKAIALGARAVMIGRPYLWGLAANGQAGVENVLDILRSGIDSALLGLGRSSVHDVTAEDLVIPTGFVRELGSAS
jgi:heme/flavin dehydrogenase (mycofactocin system)